MLWRHLSEPWKACVEEAWRAFCCGSYPIGAVVTDSSSAVVALGHNAVFATSSDGSTIWGNPMAHAEMNALLSLSHRSEDPQTWTLYTSMEPCPMCVGAVRIHGIQKVAYAARDPVAGSSSLANSTPFFRRRPIAIEGPTDLLLEQVLVTLHSAFYSTRQSAWITLAEEYSADYMPGIRLGQRLGMTGFDAYRTRGVQVAQVVDELARLLSDQGGGSRPLADEG